MTFLTSIKIHLKQKRRCRDHHITIAHLTVEKEPIKETIDTVIKSLKTDIMVVKVKKKFIGMITMKKIQEKTHADHKMMITELKENNLMISAPVSLSCKSSHTISQKDRHNLSLKSKYTFDSNP